MRTFATLAIAGTILATTGLPTFAREHDHREHAALAIPSSIVAEHQELAAALAKALRSGGRTAVAAKALDAVLAPHFEREEEFALPPLALLAPLSRGEHAPESRAILEKTEILKRELPEMLREHQAIVAKLQQLEKAATEERKPEVVRYARQLKAHALTEEQILYPTSLLIGAHLRQQPHD